jgi:hypothetical protein
MAESAHNLHKAGPVRTRPKRERFSLPSVKKTRSMEDRPEAYGTRKILPEYGSFTFCPDV